MTGVGEPAGLGEQIAQVFDGVAAAIDDRVPVADSVGNDVLVDDARGIRPAAVLVELPLAGVCLWLGAHTQQVADRRLRPLRIAGSGPNGRRRSA